MTLLVVHFPGRGQSSFFRQLQVLLLFSFGLVNLATAIKCIYVHDSIRMYDCVCVCVWVGGCVCYGEAKHSFCLPNLFSCVMVKVCNAIKYV